MKQHNPLEHFELHPLIELKLLGIDISVNKAVIMMWIVCILIPCIFVLAVRGRRMIPTRLQSLTEISIEFLRNMVIDNMGEKGLKFFFLPFFFTVALTGLEIFIAFIQAYIFTILTCVYIGEAIEMH